MSRRRRVEPGFYKHYKGSICQVIGVARNSTWPRQHAVVYRKDGKLFFDPIGYFFGKIRNSHKLCERFQKIEFLSGEGEKIYTFLNGMV